MKSPCRQTPSSNGKYGRCLIQSVYKLRTWPHIEIGLLILLVVVVAPEEYRHTWVRSHTDQFTRRTGLLNVLAMEVPNLDGHAESFPLQFFLTR